MIGNRQDREFERDRTYEVGAGPSDILAADLNADGHVDLATANSGGGDISVLFGVGPGWFAPAVSFPTGDEPVAVGSGDLNGNGEPDLVTINRGSGDVTVLVSSGRGQFEAPRVVGVANDPIGIEVADLDGDSNLDIATLSRPGPEGRRTLVVHWNRGGLNFERETVVEPVEDLVDFASGDLDGDGDLDFAIAQFVDGPHVAILSVERRENAYGLPLSVLDRVTSPGFGVGDIDGDGTAEIVNAQIWDLFVAFRVLEPEPVVVAGGPTRSRVADLSIGDFDRDGVADVFLAGSGQETSIEVLWQARAGVSRDCNGNRLPDECDGPVNGEGVLYECLPDCNANGIPDEQELGRRSSTLDCNGNRIPDECEMGTSAMADCNANGVPDACEVDCD
ncbi:MAG: VCBS repeat-containing protein, partial [Planctomycetota bacterium]